MTMVELNIDEQFLEEISINEIQESLSNNR